MSDRPLTISDPLPDLLFRRCKLSQEDTLRLAEEVQRLTTPAASGEGTDRPRKPRLLDHVWDKAQVIGCGHHVTDDGPGPLMHETRVFTVTRHWDRDGKLVDETAERAVEGEWREWTIEDSARLAAAATEGEREVDGKCSFDNAWVGKCGKGPVNERGMCQEHAKEICVSCKKPATRTCDHTGIQFVCGYPLCDECEHGIPPRGNPGMFSLGGGHHPKVVVHRQRIENDPEMADLMRREFPKEYAAAMAIDWHTESAARAAATAAAGKGEG